MRRADVRIGISGWRYESWRGVFYPEGLAQKSELRFASRKVRTVEITDRSTRCSGRRAT